MENVNVAIARLGMRRLIEGLDDMRYFGVSQEDTSTLALRVLDHLSTLDDTDCDREYSLQPTYFMRDAARICNPCG